MSARRRKWPKGSIVTMHGSMDGIRFGTINLDWDRRRFFHDRLTGVVRIEMGGRA